MGSVTDDTVAHDTVAHDTVTGDTGPGCPAADRAGAGSTGSGRTGPGGARAVTIRDARPDELAAVGEIRVGAYVAGGFLSPDAGYAPRLRALGGTGEGTVLVAIAGAGVGGEDEGTADRGAPAADGGRIVGTVMLVMPPQTSEIAAPDEAEIRALAVTPGTQGMGVGRALLQAVLDRAARQGARAMVLSTQQEMHAAHRLYERAGFTRQPARDWSPEPGLTLLAYQLTLPASGGPR
jgi:ribosomal protein S18 acetylase RimI-like enzyme